MVAELVEAVKTVYARSGDGKISQAAVRFAAAKAIAEEIISEQEAGGGGGNIETSGQRGGGADAAAPERFLRGARGA